MLSDLIGKKKIIHTSKEEYKIGISGEIGRWKMRVKNLLISGVLKKKKKRRYFKLSVVKCTNMSRATPRKNTIRI